MCERYSEPKSEDVKGNLRRKTKFIFNLVTNHNETFVVVVLTIRCLKIRSNVRKLLNKDILLGALRMSSRENRLIHIRYDMKEKRLLSTTF